MALKIALSSKVENCFLGSMRHSIDIGLEIQNWFQNFQGTPNTMHMHPYQFYYISNVCYYRPFENKQKIIWSSNLKWYSNRIKQRY